MTLIAFHGRPHIKDNLVETLKWHRKQDNFRRGTYGDWELRKFKGKEQITRVGCGVGCTVMSGDHTLYEGYYGLPSSFAYMEDHMFERLPEKKQWSAWPVDVIKAIPVGAIINESFPWKVVLRVWTKRAAEILSNLEELFPEPVDLYNKILKAVEFRIGHLRQPAAEFRWPSVDQIAVDRYPEYSLFFGSLHGLIHALFESRPYPWDLLSSLSSLYLRAGEMENNRQIALDTHGHYNLETYQRTWRVEPILAKLILEELRALPVKTRYTMKETAESIRSSTSIFIQPGEMPVYPFSSKKAVELGFKPYSNVESFELKCYDRAEAAVFFEGAMPTLAANTLPQTMPR